MTKFIHADLLQQYAQDAAECEQPWLRWQFQVDGQWIDPTEPINFDPNLKYRRKPRTININGYEVPEPVRGPLKVGEKYWLAEIARSAPVDYQWLGDYADRQWLAAGLIHLSEEAAQIHIDALLSFTRRGGE